MGGIHCILASYGRVWEIDIVSALTLFFHLDYASSVWCPYKVGDVEDIEKVWYKKALLNLLLN